MAKPCPCSDLQGMRTYAKQDGDDWILNGSKVFITNGILSGMVIVAAVTNPTAKSPAHGMSLFLVDEGTPGFKKGRMLNKMGLKAQVQKINKLTNGLTVVRAIEMPIREINKLTIGGKQ